MFRIAYVNGRYRRYSEALVHVEDRGYQFADAVYEVAEIRSGRLVDEAAHLARLDRSLASLRIAAPMAITALGVIMREVAWRNRIRDGLVYIQVSRGVAPRSHGFPAKAVVPSLVVTASHRDPKAAARSETGIAVITTQETRWARVDIKTVSLLPNVLARQKAIEVGAHEAWFVDAGGFVNEGSASNAWLVTADGVLATAPDTAQILGGITRSIVMDVAAAHRLTVEERRFNITEFAEAPEAFITSATSLVTPVVSIDGKPVGDGKPGPVAASLRAALLRRDAIGPIFAGPMVSARRFS